MQTGEAVGEVSARFAAINALFEHALIFNADRAALSLGAVLQ